ncbi:hypothetical protein ACQEV9_10185 [Streptomyces chartreusis]|uniref:hypothetical protein n=1 Tax=Streptomyces chartreusis TaxID=1969 RepID=UPI003D8D6FD2
MTEDGRRADIERIIAPLTENMPKAGDFGFDAIRRLGNPMPMLVQNQGRERLELWLEPGEAVHVTSYGTWSDHPFETIHEPGRLTVWATSWFATVTDREGNEFPPGRRDTP